MLVFFLELSRNLPFLLLGAISIYNDQLFDCICKYWDSEVQSLFSWFFLDFYLIMNYVSFWNCFHATFGSTLKIGQYFCTSGPNLHWADWTNCMAEKKKWMDEIKKWKQKKGSEFKVWRNVRGWFVFYFDARFLHHIFISLLVVRRLNCVINESDQLFVIIFNCALRFIFYL